MNRRENDDSALDLPIKKSDGKQLLASELLTRIRNKGFANSHGRLAQTGDWICLQLLVESMESALKSKQARDLRTQFAENRFGVSDRFELLALTLLHGMARTRLELPEGLSEFQAALEQLQKKELAKILRREIGSTEEIGARASGSTATDRYDSLAERVVANVRTWEMAHSREVAAAADAALESAHPKGCTRFIAEFLRTEMKQGLPSVSSDPMGYSVSGSGLPFQSENRPAGEPAAPRL